MKILTRADAARFLLEHDHFAILSHRRPDGDTVGSSAALCRGLRQLGKTAHVLVNKEVTPRFAWLHDGLTKPWVEEGDTIVSVDVASPEMLPADFRPLLGKIALRIDHHSSATSFTEQELVDGDSASCAEVVWDVLELMGVKADRALAEAVYVGVSTDTGCFRFSSTTANTHLVAAKLIEAGCHVEELNTLLFDTKPRARMEAERIARNHLEYYLDGRCALIYLTRDEIEQTGVDPADLEELTSLPISIEGVKVGLTLRQQPGGSYRISVRTAKGVDACAIARRLGGGGHNRAAGCELLGNLENAKNAILAEVEAELDAPQEDA